MVPSPNFIISWVGLETGMEAMEIVAIVVLSISYKGNNKHNNTITNL
jgi:hypothetical protein